MLVGFLDGQGRAYDLAFRTVRRRLRDADGAWAPEGDDLGAGVAVEAAMFLQAPLTQLLLRRTSGLALASGRRLVFVAGDGVERTPDEPTAFHIAIRAPATAVDRLFLEMGGREVVEVLREEVVEVTEAGDELTVRATAPWIGGGDRPAGFLLQLRPLDAAREAIAPLGLSPARRRNP